MSGHLRCAASAAALLQTLTGLAEAQTPTIRMTLSMPNRRSLLTFLTWFVLSVQPRYRSALRRKLSRAIT